MDTDKDDTTTSTNTDKNDMLNFLKYAYNFIFENQYEIKEAPWQLFIYTIYGQQINKEADVITAQVGRKSNLLSTNIYRDYMEFLSKPHIYTRWRTKQLNAITSLLNNTYAKGTLHVCSNPYDQNALKNYVYERERQNPSVLKAFRLLVMMDNLHDFGKPRGKGPGRYLVKQTTVDTFIDKINTELGLEKRFEESEEVNDKLTTSNFGSGWELGLLLQLSCNLDKKNPTSCLNFIVKIPQEYIKEYIRTLLNNNTWSNDTLGKQRAAINKYFYKYPIENPKNGKEVTQHEHDINRTHLYFSAFDGFDEYVDLKEGSHPEEQKVPCRKDPTLCMITDPYHPNQMIAYEAKLDYPNMEVSRQFNQQYGIGGKDMRNCRMEDSMDTDQKDTGCNYKRADGITECQTYLSDHLKDQGRQVNNYIDTGEDLSQFQPSVTFFFVLKFLGDYMQVREAKKQNFVFLTQDSMQFIIGAFIGAPVIRPDLTHDTKALFLSRACVELYKNIKRKMRKRGYDEVSSTPNTGVGQKPRQIFRAKRKKRKENIPISSQFLFPNFEGLNINPSFMSIN
jgi:hypothetical protein